MKIKKIKLLFVLLGIILAIGTTYNITNAETPNPINENGVILNQPVSCMGSGNCTVDEIVKVAINITKFMSAIIGSIALLFFIIAGIKMLISAGNPQAIASAKQMMTQTIIGILVFLSAYVIVTFVQETLLDTSNDGYQYKLNSDYNPNKIIK